MGSYLYGDDERRQALWQRFHAARDAHQAEEYPPRPPERLPRFVDPHNQAIGQAHVFDGNVARMLNTVSNVRNLVAGAGAPEAQRMLAMNSLLNSEITRENLSASLATALVVLAGLMAPGAQVIGEIESEFAAGVECGRPDNPCPACLATAAYNALVAHGRVLLADFAGGSGLTVEAFLASMEGHEPPSDVVDRPPVE